MLADYNRPVERVYSKTLEQEVWENVCVNCGAYQSNHYIRREAVEIDPPVVECPNCGEEHEWRPDDGLGGAFD